MSAGEFIGHGIPEEEQEFTLQVDPQGNELRFFSDGLRAVRFTARPIAGEYFQQPVLTAP